MAAAAESGGLRIAIVMMQKNEAALLPLFLRYHESLVGSSSIYLYDNGSTDRRVLRHLAAAEQRGVHVNRDHSSPEGFVHKGEIFTALIQQLDASEAFDFYFPLDCDEFLACQTGSGTACSKAAIDAALAPFREHPATLCISHKYSANPILRDHYQITTESRKCFFARGSCGWLDHGFHHGRSRSDVADESTPIIYYEFHFRRYGAYQRNSYDKVKAFHGFMLRRNLRDYIDKRVANHHCANALLQSKLSFITSFSATSHPVHDSTLTETFRRLGADDSGLFEPLPVRGRRLWLRWLALRAHLVSAGISLSDGLQEVILALPHWWRWCRRRLRGG